MKIFVLRHGQAEAQQTTDEARNLTAKGCSDVAASIQNSLSELAPASELEQLQEIWASPLVRAQQTAQIVRDILSAQGIYLSIKTTDLITPESNPAEVFDLLQASKLNSVLLASHMPFVGDFLDVLCGSARGYHAMNTSSMALVECDVPANGCGNLRWLRHVNA
jgi:phosphohistidine phosphatase